MDGTTRPNAHLPLQVRRIQQLAAAAAARRDGLLDTIDAVEQLSRIVDAWGDDMTPLTRAEVAETSGLEHDPTFDSRFDLLIAFGAVQQYRRKTSTDRYVPSPLLLVGSTMLADLAERSAVDRLVELIVVALDRVDDEDTSAEELLAIARTLTRMISVVAADINHQVDYGTVADAVEARPSRRVQRQVDRVKDLTAAMRDRFPSVLQQVRPLVEATDVFVGACDRLVDRLTREVATGGIDGLLALLTPELVDAACRTVPLETLHGFAQGHVFDRHRQQVTVEGLADAVDQIGHPRPPRQLPDPPAGDGAVSIGDAVRRSAVARRRAAQARRRWVQRTLAGTDEHVVIDDVWPAPLQRLVDALAVTDDPTLPVVADVAVRPHVDADADVAVTHPLRLRRLDTACDERSAASDEEVVR